MKTLFVKGGLVISTAITYPGGEGKAICDEATVSYEVENDHPAGIGSVVTLQGGFPFFSDAPPYVPPPAPVDPCQWLIDIGPFMDRFGAAKLPVLMSTNATVKAILQDMFARKWIDLKRPDVSQAMDAIAAYVTDVTLPLTQAILTTPLVPEENLALRKMFFS